MPADTLVERELAAIDAALEGRPVDPDMAELAELATTLRDDRMEVDPFFARELDAKAAAGFPREPRRRRFSIGAMLAPGVAVSMLVALVVGISALPRGADEDGGTGGATGVVDAMPESGAGGGAELAEPQAGGDEAAAVQEEARKAPKRNSAQPPESAGGGAAATADMDSSGGISPAIAPPPVTGGGSPKADGRTARKRETSASLALSTRPDRLQDAADRIVETTDRHRGFVVISSVNVAEGGGSASFELRVPSERLKPALADLSRIASVKERREATQDITAQFVSARERLTDARADRRGLLRRLERAATDAERDSIKARLRAVSSRISAAKADLARVENRASFSTIAVTVIGDPNASGAVDDGSWTPGDAARDAVRVLEVAAGVALIALAIGLPLALLAGLALAMVRLTSRRRRERLLDAV